jgi:hypothetical protein
MSPGAYAAVLFDFGGVLTTSVWDSFADFRARARSGRDQNLFRHGPEALADLRELGTGALTGGEFETKFGSRLG